MISCSGGQALPSEVAREVVLEAANFFFQTASSLEAEEIGLGQVALSLLPHDEEVRQQGLCLEALQELQDYGLHLLPCDYTQVCCITCQSPYHCVITLSLLPHDEEVRQQGLCLKALQELQNYGLHLLPRDHTQVCRIGASELDTAKRWTSENLLCSCVCPTDDLLDAYMWQVLRNLVCKFDSTL